MGTDKEQLQATEAPVGVDALVSDLYACASYLKKECHRGTCIRAIPHHKGVNFCDDVYCPVIDKCNGGSVVCYHVR